LEGNFKKSRNDLWQFLLWGYKKLSEEALKMSFKLQTYNMSHYEFFRTYILTLEIFGEMMS
jgi:hypothetical protein